jgi:hypothetical protein
MGEIQAKQGILLKYRSIQTLQLTELRFRVLEAMTPEKIANASLLELAKAFKILRDAELGLKGEPYKIKGTLSDFLFLFSIIFMTPLITLSGYFPVEKIQVNFISENWVPTSVRLNP